MQIAQHGRFTVADQCVRLPEQDISASPPIEQREEGLLYDCIGMQ